MEIAVAGTGYVGLSMAILLSQNNSVMAVDVVNSKVDMINSKKYIEILGNRYIKYWS